MGRYDRACRSFEEALSVWRYYTTSDNDWQINGVSDENLQEVDIIGNTPEEKETVYQLKLNMYMNIALCNLKTKSYQEAEHACNEALTLDPRNINALYRRARAIALPVNAGLQQLQKAMKDLNTVMTIYSEQEGKNLRKQIEFILKEKIRIQQLIEVNMKRESEAFSMIFSQRSSISDLMKRTTKGVDAFRLNSDQQKDLEEELLRMDKEVRIMIDDKIDEFSFGVKPGWEKSHFREVDDIQDVINNTIESYIIFKKSGKFKQAQMLRQKIKEIKYAKEHLKLVMNLDFTKPTKKMLTIAKQTNINI